MESHQQEQQGKTLIKSYYQGHWCHLYIPTDLLLAASSVPQAKLQGSMSQTASSQAKLPEVVPGTVSMYVHNHTTIYWKIQQGFLEHCLEMACQYYFFFFPSRLFSTLLILQGHFFRIDFLVKFRSMLISSIQKYKRNNTFL